MSYEALSSLFGAALIVLAASTVGMIASPRLRRSWPVRAGIAASALVVLAFAGFVAMLLSTLANLPDMSQF